MIESGGITPMSKRRIFDSEFRRQAIALVLNSELTQTQISEELGISQSVFPLGSGALPRSGGIGGIGRADPFTL